MICSVSTLHVEIGEVHRVRNHPEQLERRLLIGELLLDGGLVQLLQEELAHLIARSRSSSLRRRLELHAERLLDLRNVRRRPCRRRGLRRPRARSRHAATASAISGKTRTPAASSDRFRLPFHLHAGHEADDARDVVAANHDAFFHQRAAELRLERSERSTPRCIVGLRLARAAWRPRRQPAPACRRRTPRAPRRIARAGRTLPRSGCSASRRFSSCDRRSRPCLRTTSRCLISSSVRGVYFT